MRFSIKLQLVVGLGLSYFAFGCSEPPWESQSKPPTKYIVENGDTLSIIAEKFYGEKRTGLWQHIYEANTDVLDNPEIVQAGQILFIPAPPEENAIRN